jgi:hypothetical protein
MIESVDGGDSAQSHAKPQSKKAELTNTPIILNKWAKKTTWVIRLKVATSDMDKSNSELRKK